MPGRTALLGLAALVLALAGCGSGQTAAPSPPTAAAQSVTAGPQASGNGPPSAAQMPCDAEIRGQVQAALGLASAPVPGSSWAEQLYTCTYRLPMGPLVYSVKVEPTDAAARAHLEALRARLGATEPVANLGQQAYRTATGTVIAVKDNMVLTVDATALPDGLGPAHQRRADLAYTLATGVLNCWTGND